MALWDMVPVILLAAVLALGLKAFPGGHGGKGCMIFGTVDYDCHLHRAGGSCL